VSETNESHRASISTVHRLEFEVDWPPGHVAAYLIEGEEPILIDAGMTGETAEEELHDGLAAAGYEAGDIDHVVLTHSHTDHVGQLQTVLDAGEATVYAPARVRERFARGLDAIEDATRRNLTRAGVEEPYRTGVVDHLVDAHERNRSALTTAMVDHWIEDGEQLEVAGRSFDAIYTPGHHCTHLCYGTTLGDRRVLFAGDMAIEPFRSAALQVNFDDGVDESVDAFVEALERLSEYRFDRVYPGHGPVHDNFENAIADSQADLEARIERCAQAVADGEGVTAAAVAEQQAADLEDRGRILPEVVGALSRLAAQGEVESEMDGDVRRYL